MSISRRGFMAGILATGTAPFLAKAGMLMPVRTIEVVPALTAAELERVMFEIWSNEKLLAKFNFHGTVTGRISCNGPSWQELPKGNNSWQEASKVFKEDFSDAERRILSYKRFPSCLKLG